MSKVKGTLMVLFAACFWSTMGIFTRYLNQLGLNALEVTQIADSQRFGEDSMEGRILGAFWVLAY